jgi:hypothetical protein
VQIDGEPLLLATQRFGKVAGQGPVDATLQFGEIGQGGQQGLANGFARRRILQM